MKVPMDVLIESSGTACPFLNNMNEVTICFHRLERTSAQILWGTVQRSVPKPVMTPMYHISTKFTSCIQQLTLIVNVTKRKITLLYHCYKHSCGILHGCTSSYFPSPAYVCIMPDILVWKILTLGFIHVWM